MKMCLKYNLYMDQRYVELKLFFQHVLLPHHNFIKPNYLGIMDKSASLVNFIQRPSFIIYKKSNYAFSPRRYFMPRIFTTLGEVDENEAWVWQDQKSSISEWYIVDWIQVYWISLRNQYTYRGKNTLRHKAMRFMSIFRQRLQHAE